IVLIVDGVDRHDVWMAERRRDPRFALEPLPVLRIRCDRRLEHLERDFSAEPPIARAIYLAHAAGADEVLDVVSRNLAAGQRRTRIVRERSRRFRERGTLEKMAGCAHVAEQRTHFLEQLM